MKVIVSHPTGNANVRAVVSGLLKAGMLEKFITAIAYFNNSKWLKTIFKDANRREFDENLKPYTKTHSFYETGRHVLNKLGFSALTEKEHNPFSVASIYKELDLFLSKKIPVYGGDAFYGYEDGSYHSFKAAKKAGMRCVYELPIAYWKTLHTLLMEESERLPQWKNTITGLNDSPEKLGRKTAELDMADLVITPGKFVADSLPGWAKHKKIVIAPFGSPVNTNPEKIQAGMDENRPLRVLFAGSMSQRKGLADLFEATRLLNSKNIELVVFGSLQSPLSFYKKILPCFTYEPPRPHKEVLELMESCDVFCLPSIVEGRALVMQEAMSRGLPLIITANTGGEDLVVEGKTGFLVPVRSPQVIAEKLSWLLANRSYIREMSRAAYQHATTYTWEMYSESITSAIKTRPCNININAV